MCILNVKDHETYCGNLWCYFSGDITNCLGKKQNKTKKESRKSQQRNAFSLFCCKMKAFHHDVLPRYVLNKFKVLLCTFQNSVKWIAIDFETYIFLHNSYSEPVCLMSANLPVSHFPISFLFCHCFVMQCSSKLAWTLTLAFHWFGLQVQLTHE